jgi:hypothetical protein
MSKMLFTDLLATKAKFACERDWQSLNSFMKDTLTATNLSKIIQDKFSKR